MFGFINKVDKAIKVIWVRKKIRELTFRALALPSERTKELWVVCGLFSEQWSYAIGGIMVS